MKKIKTTYVCDLCGKAVKEENIKKVSVPALMFWENEYGISDKSEYNNVNIDLCKDCIKKVTKVRYVSGFYRELVPGKDIRLLTKEESG